VVRPQPYVTPLLQCVMPDDPHYNEARELIGLLEHVTAANDEFVPSTSLLREFIGHSFYDI